MNIIYNSEKSIDHIPNNSIFVDNILSRITRLLKDENQIVVGSKLKKLEELEKILINKDLELDNLLLKSKDIKKDIKEKSKELNLENVVIRKKLLEMLNGE